MPGTGPHRFPATSFRLYPLLFYVSLCVSLLAIIAIESHDLYTLWRFSPGSYRRTAPPPCRPLRR